jgi:hypothetical protein
MDPLPQTRSSSLKEHRQCWCSWSLLLLLLKHCVNSRRSWPPGRNHLSAPPKASSVHGQGDRGDQHLSLTLASFALQAISLDTRIALQLHNVLLLLHYSLSTCIARDIPPHPQSLHFQLALDCFYLALRNIPILHQSALYPYSTSRLIFEDQHKAAATPAP